MATQQTDIPIMSIAQATATVTPYIDFWNAVLAPKFNAWRHILAGGLHLHSAKVSRRCRSEPATGPWMWDVAGATPQLNLRGASDRPDPSSASIAAMPSSTSAAQMRRRQG